MKKIVMSLSAMLLLAACGGEPDVEETPTENESSENTEEVANETGNRATNNVSEDDVTEEQEIVFVPQESDIEAGLTVDNDDTLAQLNEMIEITEYSEIGLEDDVAIQYTGLFFDVEDNLQPIFMLTNKTDQSYTNIDIAVSFGSADGEMLFEEEGFHLSEEDFGVLRPYTAMPLYLRADPSQLELVEEISTTRDEVISIDYFDFETVDEEL
jgi:hypothetical protein